MIPTYRGSFVKSADVLRWYWRVVWHCLALLPLQARHHGLVDGVGTCKHLIVQVQPHDSTDMPWQPRAQGTQRAGLVHGTIFLPHHAHAREEPTKRLVQVLGTQILKVAGPSVFDEIFYQCSDGLICGSYRVFSKVCIPVCGFHFVSMASRHDKQWTKEGFLTFLNTVE